MSLMSAYSVRIEIRLPMWKFKPASYLVIAPLAQLPKNSRLDIKARYDMYQPNGKSNMQRTQYEAGLNFHIGKRITILTEYALINDKTLAKHNYSMADAEFCFRF